VSDNLRKQSCRCPECATFLPEGGYLVDSLRAGIHIIHPKPDGSCSDRCSLHRIDVEGEHYCSEYWDRRINGVMFPGPKCVAYNK